MKEIKSHKGWVGEYEKVETLVEDLEVLVEFQSEGEASEEDVDRKYEEALSRLTGPASA